MNTTQRTFCQQPARVVACGPRAPSGGSRLGPAALRREVRESDPACTVPGAQSQGKWKARPPRAQRALTTRFTHDRRPVSCRRAAGQILRLGFTCCAISPGVIQSAYRLTEATLWLREVECATGWANCGREAKVVGARRRPARGVGHPLQVRTLPHAAAGRVPALSLYCASPVWGYGAAALWPRHPPSRLPVPPRRDSPRAGRRGPRPRQPAPRRYPWRPARCPRLQPPAHRLSRPRRCPPKQRPPRGRRHPLPPQNPAARWWPLCPIGPVMTMSIS